MQPSSKSERRKRTIPAATNRRKREAGDVQTATVTLGHDDAQASAFMNAMERYKRENRRPFPTWSEVLEVLRSLGYRKVGAEIAAPKTIQETAAKVEYAPLPPKG